MSEKLYNPAAMQARELMVHYFEMLFIAAGLKWTHENQMEVESIVEHIIDATVTHQNANSN